MKAIAIEHGTEVIPLTLPNPFHFAQTLNHWRHQVLVRKGPSNDEVALDFLASPRIAHSLARQMNLDKVTT